MRWRKFSILKRKGKEIEARERAKRLKRANRANEAQRPQDQIRVTDARSVMLFFAKVIVSMNGIRKTPKIHCLGFSCTRHYQSVFKK